MQSGQRRPRHVPDVRSTGRGCYAAIFSHRAEAQEGNEKDQSSACAGFRAAQRVIKHRRPTAATPPSHNRGSPVAESYHSILTQRAGLRWMGERNRSIHLDAVQSSRQHRLGVSDASLGPFRRDTNRREQPRLHFRTNDAIGFNGAGESVRKLPSFAALQSQTENYQTVDRWLTGAG